VIEIPPARIAITAMTPRLLLGLSFVLGTSVAACSDGDTSNENGGSGGNAGTAGSGMPKGGTGSTAGVGGSNAGAGGATGGKGGTTGGTAGMSTGGTGGAGASGAAGKAGAGAGGSAGSATTCARWPTAQGSQSVSSTIEVNGVYDGGLKRFSGTGNLGTATQGEDQDPLFELSHNSTLRNVIIANPAADGIHCSGTCTLENVWWEDVGEDAATFRGSAPSLTMTIRCGGARSAADKVFQHNGAGTMIIQDFVAQDIGKLYRSCGNCDSQYARHVELINVDVTNAGPLVGLNENYGDTATFTDIGTSDVEAICERYIGNDTGAEPVSTGDGPDSEHCLYEASDIHGI